MLHHHRRAFLRVSIPAFAGLAAQLPLLGCAARLANADRGRLREDTPLHWDAFLEQVQAEAARQTERSWDERDYVAKAAALARRLQLDDPVIRAAFGKLTNRNPRFPEITVPHREHLFQISLIQFEPGEVIRHHDHPGMTGVLLCSTGRLEVQNYTQVGEAGSGHLVLRRDADEALARGEVGTLTSTDRNIHRVSAPVFSEVVDLFTPPYDADRIARSRWFEVDDRPQAGRPDHFLAKVKS
jgi:quercetin dioxygenase-like cupin family protein